MKRFLPLILFSFPFLSVAQTATDVLNAERSFAAYSVQHGTKAAFLKFADSTGVVFEKGKAVNAIEAWNKRQARPGVLNWYPIYGLLAASGDMGITTGPWTFQPGTINDSVVARGQFNTVWHKTPSGEWKFLLDMGISNTPDFGTGVFQLRDEKMSFTPGTLNELQAVEESLVQQTSDAALRAQAYTVAVSGQAFLLNRNGRLPTTTIADIAPLVSAMPAISYQQSQAGISRSGDLGYVYGTTIINGKDDNYLRIWRRERKAWKLALEVLPY
jgi:ketosteroid isomerase-like protein